MKTELVDLHCHYLPLVDDGAGTFAEGLELLRMAQADGISRVVLTPHIHLHRYPNVASLLRPRFIAFAQAAMAQGIDVELALGGEVRVSDDLFALIERSEIPFYAGAHGLRAILLEFSPGHLPPGWQNLLRWLKQRDIVPVIAHPERNKEVMRHPELIHDMLTEGCLIQVTAAAVTGHFGPKVEGMAKLILANGWCSLLASDAHDVQRRPPMLQAGALAAAAIVGDSRAWDMVTSIPAGLAFGAAQNRRSSTRSAVQSY